MLDSICSIENSQYYAYACLYQIGKEREKSFRPLCILIHILQKGDFQGLGDSPPAISKLGSPYKIPNYLYPRLNPEHSPNL